MKYAIMVLITAVLFNGCANRATEMISHQTGSSNPKTVSIAPAGIEHVPNTEIHLMYPSSNKKPSDLTALDVLVSVPVYPGSQKTDDVFLNSTNVGPNNLYTYEGTTEYSVPASKDVVGNWFDQTYATLGYNVQVRGSGGNFKTGHSFYMTTYASSNDHVRVELDMYPKSKNVTLINYRIEYSYVPERPQATYLPQSISKIIVTEGQEEVKGQVARKITITDSNLISNLVANINLLQKDTGGVRSCPAMIEPSGYRIAFYKQDGTVINAKVSGCMDVYVNNTALYDNKGIAVQLKELFGGKP